MAQGISILKLTFKLAVWTLFTCFYAGAASEAQLPEIAPRSTEEQQIIKAYKEVNKAVVNVNTRAKGFDFFGANSVEGGGSGAIIDAAKGYVITNHHVIEGAQQIALNLSDGQSYRVRLIGVDPDSDLALLQIIDPPPGLVAVKFGDSSTLDVGQRVLAIGNPFGLNRTLTQGIISSLERNIRGENGRLLEVIQTDAPINPGNSGGPLLDVLGRLVGLNTAIISRTGESAGIGFAVPVNTVRKAIPQLIKYGKVLRPKIGVILLDTEFGPAFLDVQAGSPAADAGLVGALRYVRQYDRYTIVLDEADFILEVNGRAVNNKTDIIDALSNIEPESTVSFKVRRGIRGKIRTVELTPILG